MHVSGVGLLQHYIRVGKTRDDIVKITYQFCVSLNIQPARVCEGITELFGVRFKTKIFLMMVVTCSVM